MHPLAYIAGTMTQFQGAVLARDQESDDIQIDKCHLRQVQNDPSLRAVDVSPQPGNVVRSNPADQTNRRGRRVRLYLDPQHKMGNPLAVHPYHRRAANVDVCGDLIRLKGPDGLSYRAGLRGLRRQDARAGPPPYGRVRRQPQ
jgi:hypothetical protein